VAWASRTSSLSEGENVIGRDPRCSVWLDTPGVTRRHAAIRVDSATRRVTLEDLGSTNGTFLRRSRVRTEVALEDGDEIKVGTVVLTIRLWASDKAPHTKRIRRRSGDHVRCAEPAMHAGFWLPALPPAFDPCWIYRAPRTRNS
jgi:predicted component of type VI protein secretion system